MENDLEDLSNHMLMQKVELSGDKLWPIAALQLEE